MRFTIGLPTDHVDRAVEFVTGEAVMACARAAETAGASSIITTEKDAVKLSSRAGLPLRAVRLSVEIAQPGFWELVRNALFPAPPAERAR